MLLAEPTVIKRAKASLRALLSGWKPTSKLTGITGDRMPSFRVKGDRQEESQNRTSAGLTRAEFVCKRTGQRSVGIGIYTSRGATEATEMPRVARGAPEQTTSTLAAKKST